MEIRQRWLMVAVGLGILLNPLNSSMIAVAIARLQQVYELDFATVSWILFSFYITSAIAQPVMGKASDMFGRKRIFLVGLVIAWIASLLAPFSATFGWLLVCRIGQSIGTSMVVAVGIAIVRHHVTEKQGTALGVLALFQSTAAAIGPFIGGVLIHWWDWPSIFFVNLPFALASFLLVWKMLPRDEPSTSVSRQLSLRQWIALLDIPGIALFTAGLVALLIGFFQAKSAGPFAYGNVILGGIGLVILAFFIRHELRVSSPFLPLRAFAKYRAMTWVHIQFVLVNVVFYAIFFGLPVYLQTVRHVPELHTGLLMLSLGLGSLIASPLAGRWIDKSGPRPALLVSAALMLFGSVWLAMLNPASPVISVCVALAAFGVSNGLNSVGMQAALFRSTPKEIIGVATGLFMTARYAGTILASLLVGLILQAKGVVLFAAVLFLLALSLLFMNGRRKSSGQPGES